MASPRLPFLAGKRKRIFSATGKAEAAAAAAERIAGGPPERSCAGFEWLRNAVAGLDADARRTFLKAADAGVSLRRRCELPGISRSTGRSVSPKRVRRLMRRLELMLVRLQSLPVAPILRSLHAPLIRRGHLHHFLRIG